MNTFSDARFSEAEPSLDAVSSEYGLLDPRTMRAHNIHQVSLPAKLFRGATSSLRLLPDFLVIGTQRGGTTSLYHYLKAHPDIELATTVDTHFFDKKYSKGLGWYRGHFPTTLEKYAAERLRKRPFVTGEACSSYLFYPHTPARVAKVLPQVKIIVFLRNPVDRAYSQYFHARELGHEKLSFEESIQDELERTAREREKILRNENYYSNDYMQRSYLSRGIYLDQLQNWMKFFPREQFLLLKTEDYYSDPASTFKKVLTFLNVPEAEPQVRKKDFKEYKHNTYYTQMDSALRERLGEYFKPHNAHLCEFLGMNFDWDK
ncbi:MAG: sulfotransferase domain-containing protein [Chloroflexota bacterium]|nr:sulfotransferase domain-containing protein [Chloroflexota bacterium]